MKKAMLAVAGLLCIGGLLALAPGGSPTTSEWEYTYFVGRAGDDLIQHTLDMLNTHGLHGGELVTVTKPLASQDDLCGFWLKRPKQPKP